MIPTLGLIVAIYAIARLLQVPIEASTLNNRWIWLLLISVPALIAIGVLALDLLLSGSGIGTPSAPGLR